MPTLTAHVTDDFVDEIDSIAVELERPRDWVIQDALSLFLWLISADMGKRGGGSSSTVCLQASPSPGSTRSG